MKKIVKPVAARNLFQKLKEIIDWQNEMVDRFEAVEEQIRKFNSGYWPDYKELEERVKKLEEKNKDRWVKGKMVDPNGNETDIRIYEDLVRESTKPSLREELKREVFSDFQLMGNGKVFPVPLTAKALDKITELVANRLRRLQPAWIADSPEGAWVKYKQIQSLIDELRGEK